MYICISCLIFSYPILSYRVFKKPFGFFRTHSVSKKTVRFFSLKIKGFRGFCTSCTRYLYQYKCTSCTGTKSDFWSYLYRYTADIQLIHDRYTACLSRYKIPKNRTVFYLPNGFSKNRSVSETILRYDKKRNKIQNK